MLELRNQRKARNRPPTVPRAANPSIVFVGHLNNPWSKNWESTTPVEPTFVGKDLEMYTFRLSDNGAFTDRPFYNKTDKCIICKVFSSQDLKTPRSIVYNNCTFHGLPPTSVSDCMSIGKFASNNTKNIEIPVGFWGPHDPTCKLTLELIVKNYESSTNLYSSQFSATTTSTSHLS